MHPLSQGYVEQIVSCIMRSLPPQWDMVTFTFEYDEESVLQHGIIKQENTQKNLRITKESGCATQVADVAMCLQLAMLEEVGQAPSKAVFEIFQNKDANIFFEYPR